MTNHNVEFFTETSEQIKAQKTEIVNSVVALHEQLSALAQYERVLEDERLKGVVHTHGRPENAPDLIEPLNEYASQIQIPVVQVWGFVNSIISHIYQHTSAARGELPALFARSNRIDDIKG